MSVASSTASIVGFVVVFVGAYRFNRSDYHDSALKSVVGALLLA